MYDECSKIWYNPLIFFMPLYSKDCREVVMDHSEISSDVQSNIFSFPNPDELGCVMKSYTINHAVMVLKVIDFNNYENRLVEFQSVQYFSGPISWTSANFQIRPWQECVKLLIELNRIPSLAQMPQQMQQEMGEKNFKLYVVSAVNPAMEIKILASSAALV